MSDVSRTPGALRLSKGAWLFAPDGVDVLLRVDPRPAPSTEGFFSQPISARLEVTSRTCRPGVGQAIEPRTGVPDRVAGRVVEAGAGFIVIDAGIPLVVQGATAAVGDDVEVEIDVDAGVACLIG